MSPGVERSVASYSSSGVHPAVIGCEMFTAWKIVVQPDCGLLFWAP